MLLSKGVVLSGCLKLKAFQLAKVVVVNNLIEMFLTTAVETTGLDTAIF